ncbi:MAG: hypothetical protein JW841_16835 [Deltaproteobacteria bacterium]|nr:hypothetical protein [Deltaproteobacteria bacterium]
MLFAGFSKALIAVSTVTIVTGFGYCGYFQYYQPRPSPAIPEPQTLFITEVAQKTLFAETTSDKV